MCVTGAWAFDAGVVWARSSTKSVDDRLRLVTAVQVRKTNDCCYRKQSLHQDFREGQLYPLKLPVESDHCQVTALPCADLVLSTHCCRWQRRRPCPRCSGTRSSNDLHSSPIDRKAGENNF